MPRTAASQSEGLLGRPDQGLLAGPVPTAARALPAGRGGPWGARPTCGHRLRALLREAGRLEGAGCKDKKIKKIWTLPWLLLREAGFFNRGWTR